MSQNTKDSSIVLLVADLNELDEDPLTADALRELLHRRGVCMRHLGLISSAVRLNHTKELLVIEIIARCAKRVIRQRLAQILISGLPSLETPSQTFITSQEDSFNVLLEKALQKLAAALTDLISLEHPESAKANIWNDIAVLSKQKFALYVDRDTLSRIHVPALFMNVCEKLNLRLKEQPCEGGSLDIINAPLVSPDHFASFEPLAKDYSEERCELAGLSQIASFHYMLDKARRKDAEGTRSLWHIKQGEERKTATLLFEICIQCADQIF